MLLRLLSFGLAFLFWQALAFMLPPSILPGPIATSIVLWENLVAGDVFRHLWITLLRVFGGLALAMAIAVPVGVLMGVHRSAERVLDIWVMVAMTIPSLCYALICFIWLGLNEYAAIVAIAVTAAPSRWRRSRAPARSGSTTASARSSPASAPISSRSTSRSRI